MNKNALSYILHIASQLTSIYTTKPEQIQVAWWLLEAITNKTKSQLIAIKSFELTNDQNKKLKEWVREHTVDQKPLQYIIGSITFGPLTLITKEPTLIPRPETEEWVLSLAKELSTLKNKNLKILDLCTGSGCIALLLGHYLPEATITASDSSQEALFLASENISKNNISNVELVKSDLFAAFDSKKDQFDLIVTNPPYISTTEWNQLDIMVSKWEDKNALISDENGLSHIKKIIEDCASFIKKNDAMKELCIPQIVIEIGHRQGRVVAQFFKEKMFTSIKIKKDMANKDRIVSARIDR